MTENGHGSQIVQVTDDHKYILDETELQQVLLHEDIRDLPVVVVSVAGAYRGGKSFLLNFFLRYLNSPPSSREDGSWLGKEGEPLFGFSWRGGSKRNTTGILLWSKPTIVTLPSGVKAAVLLMDTQGTFDNTSTVRDCSTIFALSTLLASIQIYNLTHNIQEDDLQHLELFTEYGKLLKTQNSEKAFQVLEFLVRDWQFFWEYQYGTEGGEKLLEVRLQDDPKMPKELRELRAHIRSSFNKVSCYLMPHPGFKVLSPSFNGSIQDISEDFKRHLILLVTGIFGLEKLQPKLINGEMVKARELFTYIKTYIELFNSDKIPTPTSIMEATTKAGLLTAYNEGLAQYVTDMERECGEKKPCVPAVDMKVLHDRYKGVALSNFTSKKKMGSSQKANQYYEKLSKDIESRLKEFTSSNALKQSKAIESAKATYDAEISKVSDGKEFCVHPKDLEVIHNMAAKAAINVFDTARKRITEQADPSRDNFIQRIESEYLLLKQSNDTNHKLITSELRNEYWLYMETKTSVEPSLTRKELQKEHEIGLAKILEDFKKKRNRPDSYTEDVYKHNLIEAITNRYNQLAEINKSANRKGLMASLAEYNSYIAGAWNQRTESLHPEDLKNDHQTALCKALETFRPRKKCAAGFDKADDDEKILQKQIKSRYNELLDVNNARNNEAISSAMMVYMDSFEERNSPSWWWVTLVPAAVYAVKNFTSVYHRESREDAITEFYSKRRNNGPQKTDTYFKKLNDLISNKDYWKPFWENVDEELQKLVSGLLLQGWQVINKN